MMTLTKSMTIVNAVATMKEATNGQKKILGMLSLMVCMVICLQTLLCMMQSWNRWDSKEHIAGIK